MQFDIDAVLFIFIPILFQMNKNYAWNLYEYIYVFRIFARFDVYFFPLSIKNVIYYLILIYSYTYIMKKYI